MWLKQANILALLLFVTHISNTQELHNYGLGTASDLCLYDNDPISLTVIEEVFVANSEVIFCPAGIERSSENDVRKRKRFSWEVRFNNIYFRNPDGIVYEGMNEHGFSASLMYMENVVLPEKDKELIPIASSLIVNFFIDHFNCVDTALLAVWDIRIFDDMELDGGWPFRIILHDTTGASAYIEYNKNGRSVYTPDHPSYIVSGSIYERLLMLRHMPDSLPANKVETMYMDMISTGLPSDSELILLRQYMKNFPGKEYFSFFRYHAGKELYILTPSNDEVNFNFREIDFIPGKETITRFF